MVRCIDCAKLEKCAKASGKPQIVEVVPGCEDGKRKPITNGDKIRAMSDKELAEWLLEREVSIAFQLAEIAGCTINYLPITCYGNLLHWLKKEGE